MHSDEAKKLRNVNELPAGELETHARHEAKAETELADDARLALRRLVRAMGRLAARRQFLGVASGTSPDNGTEDSQTAAKRK